MKKKKTILIADAHFLVRQGLQTIFVNHPEFAVVADTGSYDTVKSLLSIYKPDILLIGLNVQGTSAEAVILEILQTSEQKVLVLDTNEDYDSVVRLLESGVHGYILKQCDAAEIIEASNAICADKNFFCGNVLNIRKDKSSPNIIESRILSSREMEVLRFIAEGLTNNEIADKLNLSAHTIASHRKNLMRKFNAKNNVDLVVSAIKENGLTILS